jgi:hypothetical protein
MLARFRTSRSFSCFPSAEFLEALTISQNLTQELSKDTMTSSRAISLMNGYRGCGENFAEMNDLILTLCIAKKIVQARFAYGLTWVIS